MHLADLDENGTIDKEELVANKRAFNLLSDSFEKVNRNFLTKGDIVKLIPEIQALKKLVDDLASCLSNAKYDPFLLNRKIKPVRICTYILHRDNNSICRISASFYRLASFQMYVGDEIKNFQTIFKFLSFWFI